jgi:hypothetical protein
MTLFTQFFEMGDCAKGWFRDRWFLTLFITPMCA